YLLGLVIAVPLFALTGVGFLHEQRATFESMPPDDHGLLRWLRERYPETTFDVSRAGNAVRFEYERGVLGSQPVVPWPTLGYHELRGISFGYELSTRAMPALIAIVLLSGQAGFLAIALRRRARARSRGEPVPEWSGGTRSSLLVGCAAGAALFGLGWVHDLAVAKVFGAQPSVWNATLAFPAWGKWLVAVLGATAAPACEEVFFRGHVFASFDIAGHRRAGYVVSTLLFAAAHLDPVNVVFYVAAGLVLAWVFVRTRSLGAAIAAHLVTNAASFALMYV
ncbi:MAG TPA: CPBP family intramembrane glutamic endopeptidase, partial [Planctomycetota bacterium]|nr:CPBP family intramembrane glutamic endopeptidase [Planctomycetota bacterium]